MIDTSGVALEIIKDSESVIREISQQPRIWRSLGVGAAAGIGLAKLYTGA